MRTLTSMTNRELPPPDEMYRALCRRDTSYDGVFVTAVRTTGIFCRPSCPARKPRPENVEFHATVRDALFAGYRPCRRCRPMEEPGRAPPWVRELLAVVDDDPTRRWTDRDLRERGLDPSRVRRWFQAHHGMTFHAYQRARRLGMALGRLRNGEDLTRTAYDNGYESLSGFREAFKRTFGAAPGRGRHTARIVLRRLVTPLGPMVAGATEDAVCLLEFADRRMLETQVERVSARLGAVPVPGTNELLDGLAEELAAYFEGRVRAFASPLTTPGTAFQEAVWDELARIPYGETVSYADLARRVGRPDAVRAIARANGDNRLAILLPCHRVVGSDGRLRGYGGGLWRKRYLLELERDHGRGRPGEAGAGSGQAGASLAG